MGRVVREGRNRLRLRLLNAHRSSRYRNNINRRRRSNKFRRRRRNFRNWLANLSP